ncbi:Carboxymuconolactone decarboxylase family, putative [Angomonas deanei]|uniref:Carboxymuconolactone decarboxylase family, putative n=1 Tax=Angomonas deanei TaxID=59799 RepID=A0A7G2CP13_9TRYP|nr:Carboxymuconolactone decarboxylase family, putative [Angomonas deanei]
MNFSGYQYVQETCQCLKLAEQSMAQNFSISPLMFELARIRAAQLNNCFVCAQARITVALEKGEKMDRILAIPVWKEAGDVFTPQERAALLWSETLTNTNINGIPDDVVKKVKVFLSPKELSELTTCITTMNMWNRQSVALEQLESYMSGGKAPAEDHHHHEEADHHHADEEEHSHHHEEAPAAAAAAVDDDDEL